VVKSGSSYLSASDLRLTFGVAGSKQVERVVVYWPSGRVDEVKKLATGLTYRWVEGELPKPLDWR
jgi:hypothetical protein